MRVSNYLSIALLTLFLISCGPDRYQHQVNITATDYQFEAPETIEAGWTTFNMVNEGTEEHFMLISSVPEDMPLEEVQKVAAWRKELRDAYLAGDISKDSLLIRVDAGMPVINEMVYQGGVGMLSPGKSASATYDMKPGRYILQCYVRNAEGVAHDALGMVKELVVKPSETATQKPTAGNAISIKNNGSSYPGTLLTGTHTLQIYFNQQPEHGFRGNDINLYRLKEGYTKADVKVWIDVFEEGGMITPAPAIFVGGALELPARASAYFTVELDSGAYHNIAEKDLKAPGNTFSFDVYTDEDSVGFEIDDEQMSANF